MFEKNSRKFSTYVDELDSFDELVVAVEDQYGRELPVPGGVLLAEVGPDVGAVLLVDGFQSGQVADDHLHLDNRLINLALEHLRRVQERPTLRETTTGSIYKISYDLSYDYRKCIARSTYDSDLKRGEISL